MQIALGAIADDYTGASDLANTFAKAGLRTVQTVGIPDPALDLPEVDAVVVSLKIRSVAAGTAVSAAMEAERWLRSRGAEHVLYKICSTFDSTDAGNIGPVTAALQAASGEALVLVTPAFPETGRTVYRGHLFVGDQLLSDSPLKDHPLNPMRDSSLVRVLSRQMAGGPVGLVDLATIARGAEAVTERLADLRAAGYGAAIADAVSESDLLVLGEVALRARTSTGASGLGLGLARAIRRQRGGSAVTGAAMSAPVGGLAAAIAGSCSKATLEQMTAAEAVMPVLRLDPEVLVGAGAGAEVDRALAFADAHLATGPVLIAAGASPDVVAGLQARFGRDASGHAIEQATAAIAEGLVARGVRRLVVAGGETSGAAVDRLAIPAFLVEQEIAAGVPILRTLGTGPAMRLALKSGNFGGRDFFADALGLMA